MDIGELKQQLQNHFTDGLVTIVGSGLSAAEGISGMGGLKDHLVANVPKRVARESLPMWTLISQELAKGTDLESTLSKHPPDDALETIIVDETSKLILAEESKIISDVLNNNRCLRLSRLLKHMLKSSNGIPIITTNYDRLVEVAAETAGLGIDSLFVGHNVASFDPMGSRHSLCRSVERRGKSVVRTFCEHVVVLKPHGSLDWFQKGEDPVRCAFPLHGSRLIITPGLNKFRGGYNRPFDAHRERANQEIDKASRFLTLGYGFNDEHLQTHLETQLHRGLPTVLMSRSLSQKAEELVGTCKSIMAIVAHESEDGAVVWQGGKSMFFPGPNLWDLGTFVTEVLE